MIDDDNYNKIVAENKELKEDLLNTKNTLHEYVQKLFNSESKISGMESVSGLASGVSYIIAMLFTVLSMHSLAPSAGSNAIIGVCWGAWFFGVFTYYGVWRWVWRK